MSKEPVIVAVTGGAGQIAYSLLPPLLSGAVFGADQPVKLQLLDVEPAMVALNGVIMECEDLAYPLYAGAIGTSDPAVAFKDADYAIFLGAFPRKDGMERKDVMEKNVGIFNGQGAALKGSKPSVKCLVVGNPANTNAAILLAASGLPSKSITCLTRLDHNRARSMVAIKAGAAVGDTDGVIIWGNHSSTQYPDVRHATVAGKPVLDALPREWLEGEFVTTVQKRGAAIIAARKLSSAASAAKAICDHMRDWAQGTGDKFVSMGVFTDGSKYGVPAGICYSLPCKCAGGEWSVVEGLPIDAFSQAAMDKTKAELEEELKLAKSLLG